MILIYAWKAKQWHILAVEVTQLRHTYSLKRIKANTCDFMRVFFFFFLRRWITQFTKDNTAELVMYNP